MTDRIVQLKDSSNNQIFPVGFAPAGAVTTSMYTDASITSPKLADNSVTTSKIANNSVTTEKISPGAIVDGIQASSITSEKLADGSVTSAKLADSAATTTKIADSAITDAKIDWSTMGGVDYLSQCTTTSFTLGNGSYLKKFPNGLVVFFITGSNTATFNTGGASFLTLPSGFYPGIEYMFFSGSNPWNSATCNFAIYTTNSTTYLRAYPLANRSSGTRFDLAGCYFAAS